MTDNTLRVEFGSLERDEDGAMCYQGQLFTGIAVDYWPNGQLATEQYYTNGAETGLIRGWHDNGILCLEATLEAECIKGIGREWHRNGQLKREEEVEEGICLWRKEWDEQGVLVKEYVLTEVHPNYKSLQIGREMRQRKA
jgi:antitoxin component YwqK of YwqJK toxin-antitoxin module